MELNANKTIEAYCKIWEQLNANNLDSLLRKEITLGKLGGKKIDTPHAIVTIHKIVFDILKEIPIPGIIVKWRLNGQPGWLEDPRYLVDVYTSNNELILSQEIITIGKDIRKITIKEDLISAIGNQYTKND